MTSSVWTVPWKHEMPSISVMLVLRQSVFSRRRTNWRTLLMSLRSVFHSPVKNASVPRLGGTASTSISNTTPLLFVFLLVLRRAVKRRRLLANMEGRSSMMMRRRMETWMRMEATTMKTPLCELVVSTDSESLWSATVVMDLFFPAQPSHCHI